MEFEPLRKLKRHDDRIITPAIVLQLLAIATSLAVIVILVWCAWRFINR